MADRLYKFVAILPRGDVADLHYLPAHNTLTWEHQRHAAPHFRVARACCDEIQAAAPGHQLLGPPFRIVRDYGTHVNLEWI
jgi:hypothetical protein